jgi:hypothetical protein
MLFAKQSAMESHIFASRAGIKRALKASHTPERELELKMIPNATLHIKAFCGQEEGAGKGQRITLRMKRLSFGLTVLRSFLLSLAQGQINTQLIALTRLAIMNEETFDGQPLLNRRLIGCQKITG